MIYVLCLKCHGRFLGVSQAAQGPLAAIRVLSPGLATLPPSSSPDYRAFWLCFYLVSWVHDFEIRSSLPGLLFFCISANRTLGPERTLLRVGILEEGALAGHPDSSVCSSYSPCWSPQPPCVPHARSLSWGRDLVLI